MLPRRIGRFNENCLRSSKLVPNYVFLTLRMWARQGELRADASVCGSQLLLPLSTPILPLCQQQSARWEGQRKGTKRSTERLSQAINPKLPQAQKCFYGLVGWKVVGLYEVGVHPPPTQLSGKRWMGILLGSEKEPAARGNKCVLTSTLLSTRWFISSDDSNANSNGGILPRPPSSSDGASSNVEAGWWVVGDYKIPPECHRHVPIDHLEMTLG